VRNSFEPEAYRTLVLDADGQAGLQVVRSLGRRGVPVTAGASVVRSLGALSRFSDDAVVHPDVINRPNTFLDWLADVLVDGTYFAVLPVSDETSMVVSRHKDRLSGTGATIGVGDWERTQQVYDKARTFELAADLDLPIPETHAPESFEDVDRIADDLTYPVVIKTRSKHVWTDDGRLQLHRVGDDNYAAGPRELRSLYRRVLQRNEYLKDYPPLVQERIDGQTTTTTGLAEDGTLRVTFQELRLRTTPASGGNSTLVRGYRDAKMREYATELLDALDWTGPVQVEFMRTPNNEYYLIEVNGRYWGSVPLAVASGVDVPWYHFCQLCGHTPSTPPVYRDDVVQQRLFYGDLKWLAEQLDQGRVTAIGTVARSLVRDSPVFFSLSDPLPTGEVLFDAGTKGAKTVFQHLRNDGHGGRREETSGRPPDSRQNPQSDWEPTSGA